MARRNKIELIAGLDVGSSAVRIAVGQHVFGSNEESGVQIIGAAEAPSAGVQKGVVTSIEEVISAVSHVLEQIERLLGLPIENTWVGITGADVLSEKSRGVISVAKADGEISAEDVQRSVEAAKSIAVPLNYDMLHVIPRSYTVDGQTGIKDPVGMTGLRLEVDTQIIHGVSSHLKNITKAVYRTGIDIDDIVLSVLAAGDAVATQRQKQLGVAVVNIGGATTSLVVYEGGDILHTVVLPIGSEHVTNDLAIGLRTSIDVAERIKIECGECVSRHVSKKDKINLADFGGEEEVVSRHLIAQIIEARVGEILEKIGNELGYIDRSGLLPAGIIFTGGGAKLDGLVELSKNTLRLPATLGYPIDIPSVVHQSNDLSFASAIGLVKWGSNLGQVGVSNKKNPTQAANKLIKKIQNAGRWLMP